MQEPVKLNRPKWLRDLERLLGVRRQFVLEQNIRDEVALPNAEGFDLLPFTDALRSELRRLQYSMVLLWNPVTGLAVFPKNEETLTVARRIEGLENLNPTGELDMPSLLRLSKLVARIGQGDPCVPSCALIIDYASRIAKKAGTLSDDDPNFFLACEKAANDAQPVAQKGSPPRFNPVIWLCNRAQDLPSWFLLDNSGIHVITVSTPDLDTRLAVAASVVESLDPQSYDRENASEARIQANASATKSLASQTDGMRLTALKEIGGLARNSGIPLEEIDRAVKTYKLGDLVKASPWQSDGLRKKIREADREGFFPGRVKGQALAVLKVLDMLKRSVFGLTGAHSRSSDSRPKGIMFFAGPTGVGKTEMAKAIADMIFEDPGALLRFDMSEFSSEHSDARLIGAPPGYTGYDVGGELTNALREKPYRVILFDEIEKAHPRILDKFLQILEDGRLTDGRGETVYFSESLIIFTSNLGIYVKQQVGDQVIRVPNVTPETKPYEEVERRIRRAIIDHFRLELNRPEILNRIGEDNIVVFGFIDKEAARAIFKGNLDGILSKLQEERDITVLLEPEAQSALEAHCIDDLANGGRGIGSRLEAAFTNSLTRALFDSDASAESQWRVANFAKDPSGAFSVKLEAQH